METHYLHPDKCHQPLPPAEPISIASIRLGEPFNKPVRAGAITLKAVSLKIVGLRTPIKVRPLSQDEKNQDPIHQYELVAGESRLKAAILLDWENIDAYVLDLTPDEAFLEAWWDNKRPTSVWSDIYMEFRGKLKLPHITLEKATEIT